MTQAGEILLGHMDMIEKIDENRRQRHRLIWQDFVIVLALIFHLGAFMATNYIVAGYNEVGIAVERLEIDPIMRWALGFSYMQYILGTFSYTLLIISYLYARRQVLEGKAPIYYLNGMAIGLFYVFSRDFLGDFGIVLRMIQMAKGG